MGLEAVVGVEVGGGRRKNPRGNIKHAHKGGHALAWEIPLVSLSIPSFIYTRG